MEYLTSKHYIKSYCFFFLHVYNEFHILFIEEASTILYTFLRNSTHNYVYILLSYFSCLLTSTLCLQYTLSNFHSLTSLETESHSHPRSHLLAPESLTKVSILEPSDSGSRSVSDWIERVCIWIQRM